MNTCTRCVHLRTKSMYVPALAQGQTTQAEEQPPLSSHSWCNRTLTETGPDEKPVGPQVCDPSRSCFASGKDFSY